MSNIKKVLKERGSRYGDFDTFADISQQLKDIVYLNLSLDANEEKNNINNIISEGLDMIMHKLARILNGDPYYLDSWTDLQGYASLVEKELKEFNELQNKELNNWKEKCLDCKYMHHIVEPKEEIDFYVCEHSDNIDKSNVKKNGKVIEKYKDIEKIWKDCKFKESILK